MWGTDPLRTYRNGCQDLHSKVRMGVVSGGPTFIRITPSEVEQKFLLPVLALIGVASATYWAHCS